MADVPFSHCEQCQTTNTCEAMHSCAQVYLPGRPMPAPEAVASVQAQVEQLIASGGLSGVSADIERIRAERQAAGDAAAGVGRGPVPVVVGGVMPPAAPAAPAAAQRVVLARCDGLTIRRVLGGVLIVPRLENGAEAGLPAVAVDGDGLGRLVAAWLDQ